ncbi:hypothetical protein [Kitasatospora sp. NPDC101183]|uniref:hypothetical protein n=1 Tax=Kitasatospora sp. NPDC101183 TaxID=3364100 RepID=UPI003823C679
MRAVARAIPREVKDGFRYDEIPWRRFWHFYGPGEEVPGLLDMLASTDAGAADRVLWRIREALHHQGGTIEAGALAVPFLFRIARARPSGLRAEILRLVGEIGRCQHLGDGSRAGFLQVSEDSMTMGAAECPVDWAIQAAREAVTDDLHLLLPQLSDLDPEVRSAAAFVLAEVTGEVPRVSTALHGRLAVEEDPAVRVTLVLAIAQLAQLAREHREHRRHREHRDEGAPAWARGLWSDPGRRPEDRIGAGLAWLCLVDDPAPDELRAFLTDPGTVRFGDALQGVPWIASVDHVAGLRSCVGEMLPRGS